MTWAGPGALRRDLAVVAAVLAGACGLLGILLVGVRSGAGGKVRCVNATDRDFWFSYPSPVDGAATFDSEAVPAHDSIDLAADRPREGELWQVLAFDRDPGPPVPSVSVPGGAAVPVAQLKITGGQLLRSRSEGPLELILETRGRGVGLRVSRYVSRSR